MANIQAVLVNGLQAVFKKQSGIEFSASADMIWFITLAGYCFFLPSILLFFLREKEVFAL